MTHWLQRAAELVAEHGAAARVTIVATEGPTPREIGAALLVTGTTCEGKIGRGPLEAAAIAAARELLDKARIAPDGPPRWLRACHRHATGPVLGELSGGEITLLVEVLGPAEVAALAPALARAEEGLVLARPFATGTAIRVLGAAAPEAGDIALQLSALDAAIAAGRRVAIVAGAQPGEAWLLERLDPRGVPFYVWGTGLVARALVRALDGLPFEVVWVDNDATRFRSPAGEHETTVVTDDPLGLAAGAPAGSFHAVMTVSHEFDYALCRALLARGGPAFVGVIGSRMKRERLLRRLAEDGVSGAALSRLVCPIGLPEIRSKSPAVIAIAIAAQALIALQAGDSAGPVRQPAGSKR